MFSLIKFLFQRYKNKVYIQAYKKARINLATYPMTQVVGEHQITGERVGERVIKIEHFEQLVPFDGMQVAVGQRSHVGRRLPYTAFLPESVAKDIAFTYTSTKDNAVLYVNFIYFSFTPTVYTTSYQLSDITQYTSIVYSNKQEMIKGHTGKELYKDNRGWQFGTRANSRLLYYESEESYIEGASRALSLACAKAFKLR